MMHLDDILPPAKRKVRWQPGDQAYVGGELVTLKEPHPTAELWVVQGPSGAMWYESIYKLVPLVPLFGPKPCTCNIRDLWARGHDEGCGERR